MHPWIMRATVSQQSTVTSGGDPDPEVPVGDLISADNFNGLANGTTIHLRTLPTGGGQWQTRSSGPGPVGDGNNMIRYNTAVRWQKYNPPTGTSASAVAIVRYRDSGEAGLVNLHSADNQSSDDPRWGHMAEIQTTRVRFHKVDAWAYETTTDVSITLPSSWTASSFNEYALKRDGTALTVYINGTQVATHTTDGSFSTNNKWAVGRGGTWTDTSNPSRLDWFEIYELP
jgi:hypothetical protein